MAMLIMGGCSTNVSKPLEAPAGTSVSAPQPMPEEAPVAEPEEMVPPVPDTPVQATLPETPEPEDDSLVVIDTGAIDITESPQTLADAARAERERRHIATPTDIVITDKTLKEFATGDLTVATPSTAAQKKVSEASELQREMAEKEAFWRAGVREIRQAWRDAYDKIPVLEEKVFQLRQAFFREDDGFYRDAEIKPAWDRAIEQLEQAHLEVAARQKELAAFLEEGHGAGALPGWLREGIDLEPDPQVVEEPSAEPGEPVIYQPEATDPP